MNKPVQFAVLLAALFIAVLLPIGLAAAGVWSGLEAEQRGAVTTLLRENVALIVAAGVGLLIALALVVQVLFELYVSPPLKIAEGAKVILNANPSHRIEPVGGSSLQRLVEVINAFAAKQEALQHGLDARIEEAQAKVADERNRLAALISELTQSVLVCNADGRILLYNQRAQQLLERRGDREAPVGGASPVGLGRSVFGVIERSLIAHALEEIEDRLRKGELAPVARFLTTTGAGQLIRVQVTPVLGSAGNSGRASGNGFVLLLEDVTEMVEAGSRKDVLLQSLTEGSRRALANIRAAAEMLQAHPEMGGPKHAQFIRVIEEEATRLGAHLEQTAGEHAASAESEWLLEDVHGSDLISATCRGLERKLGLRTRVESVDPNVWLKVDGYSWVQVMTYLARRLRDQRGIREVGLRMSSAGRLANVDLSWNDGSANPVEMTRWESEPMSAAGEASPLTVKQVLERHRAEILYRVDKAAGIAFLRVLLPMAQPRQTLLPLRKIEPARPEYYDFDLFHQAGQTPEVDERRLTDLAYTVFDTETTGLEPSRGDEIVAIGAVRIVNGRLLHHEVFEQLVDPRRPMSADAVRITGIDSTMLEGQPAIEKVLPEFHNFCEDTVLVAHNAAFDMRFLQLKEERAGVRFSQPVLDTLLLAAVVHPHLESVTLEKMVQLFGVNPIGRHTALGDAIMTAEVLLKMIPLLADKGVVTLRDARAASEKTYYARLHY
ncbi:MAG TPA: exonuclease domain-containing protein [Myxococcaceae bacterium]|nr:exonuclease domain-containing protein [Myxococcaceae bacterium]